MTEKFLLIADSPFYATSYAVVGRELMKMLDGKYELYYAGINYIGQPIKYQNFTLFSTMTIENAQKYMMDKKFDHIIYLRNAWVSTLPNDLMRYLHLYSDDVILYTPVEERYLPKRFFTGLKSFDKEHQWYDRMLTMTQFGVKVIGQYGIEADYLYHNLNEKKVKHTDSYIDNAVLNISYSQDYRKNLGTYVLLAKLNPDYIFNFVGRSTYYVLTDYIDIYGIKNFQFLNTIENNFDASFLTDEEIAEIYAKHHFYFQVSYKEGFDLTTLEALSNGLITFMPNDDLHKELFSQFPNAVFVNGNYIIPMQNQQEYTIFLSDWQTAFEKNKNRKKMGIRKDDRFKFENVRDKLLKILGDK